MKKRINISIIITALILTISIVLSSYHNDDGINNTSIQTHNSSYDEAENSSEEMRGLWVSYISLDMQNTDKSFEKFKEKFNNIIREAKKIKCNTLIVQARPFSDALYNSDLFPYSHILSGTQGVYPNYDALEYMCNEAHNSDLSIHVWINPYRVKLKDTPRNLAENNIYVTNPELCIETESGIYINPSKKKGRELITKGVREIIGNYDVDGIQFDDYFYPPDVNEEDYSDYSVYKKALSSDTTPLEIEEWRMNNINILIAEVYKAIKDFDKNILFGISPQGNISNNTEINADILSWCKYRGYIDYICPQMYYSIDNPALRFEDCLKVWSEIPCHKELKIHIGLAVYKAGTDEDDGTWLSADNILAEELKLLRKYNFSGYMLYDYNALESDKATQELKNLVSVI